MSDPLPQHRIVTIRARPRRRLLMAVLVGASLAVAGFAGYQYLKSRTFSEFREARTELDQLRDERRQLAQQLRAERATTAELRQQVVYAERSTDIDGQACSSVKDSLAGLQAEAADLREQVAFYRGIVSPDETKAGVRVLDLRVSARPDAQRWRYDLVLIQSVRHDKRVSGTTQVRLSGTQDGRPATLDLAALLLDDGRLPSFAFKYFQEFSGEFQLPSGFKPARMAVTLAVEGDAATKVEDEYDWSKIQQEKSPS